MSFGKLGAMGRGMGHLGALGNASISPPAGFNWPFATYPLTVRQTGANSFSTNFNPESYAAAALAGPVIYVAGNGSDAGSGTSGSPYRSIWKAIQAGNALAVPYKVSIDCSVSGSFPRENGFTNNNTLVPATQPAAFVATGGRAEVWTGSTLTWPGSPDPSFPNTYLVTRSNGSRVIYLGSTDANGDYLEIPQLADAAAVNASSYGWAQVGTNTQIQIRLPGGVAPTNSNCRVMLKTINNLVLGATSKDMYLSGIDLQGGSGAGVAMNAAATLNFIAVDCSAKFAGDSAAAVNGFKLDFITGLAALVRCVAACNEVDGINTHWSPGGTSGIYTLTIDCIGRNNGRDTATSCNGLTSHDGAISIDVNGQYFGNYGGNVVPIHTCQVWGLGTYAHDSNGDTSHGGSITPQDFNTKNTAKMWLQNCRSAVSTNSLVADDTSTILTRNFSGGVGQTQSAAAGATIGTF
jgi:hypothetical protein